ncbi:MAG TPA: hypothetical protein VEL11_08440 [Candidatus Bathyarchaeia archaeon]|nr:hypothetical protein [Candidatus Bathyarchaeia archaeon]
MHLSLRVSFGKALQYRLENDRVDTENPDYALWVEEDYCTPPERVYLINTSYLTVESVESEEDGWNKIEDKPRLWK